MVNFDSIVNVNVLKWHSESLFLLSWSGGGLGGRSLMVEGSGGAVERGCGRPLRYSI